MYIQFNDLRQTKYEIINYEFVEFPNIVRIYYRDDNVFCDNIGFKIYSDEETCVYDFSEYYYVYDSTDEYIEYNKKDTVYYIYYEYNWEKYVTRQFSSEKDNISDCYLVCSGKGKKYRFPEALDIVDENGLYNYQLVDNQIVKISKEDKDKILEINRQNAYNATLENKIKELTNACQSVIVAGIVYNEEHYSYTVTDQNNISNLVSMARTTGMNVPYHSDKSLCRLYTPEDIYNIYILQEINVTSNTTYLNQLKAYVYTLTDIKDVQVVQYGQELTGEYLDNYKTIMEHSQKIIEVLNAETAKITQ